MQAHSKVIVLLVCVSSALIYVAYIWRTTLARSNTPPSSPAFAFQSAGASGLDLDWYPPSDTWITDLNKVIGGQGTYGFDFRNVVSPSDGRYAYCNMPRVHDNNYLIASRDEYELLYVEVVHRHHRRTPYVDNGFPIEPLAWDCTEREYQMSEPADDGHHSSAKVYWTVKQSSSNPFTCKGLHGTCRFPQITEEGQEDSWQHGQDLASVYRDLLGFLPAQYSDTVSFRVTNNIITAKIASMVSTGMFPDIDTQDIPLRIEPELVDSLEPQYSCPAAQRLTKSSILGGNPTWQSHLASTRETFSQLDKISGVSATDTGFHISFDHYFDNLSTRQCHERPLPCSSTSQRDCITQDLANIVYRLGQWEYSWQHRGSPHSLTAAIGAYGVWFAELAQNLRDAASGRNPMRFRHNVAHDGSMARMLSILQVDVMVWPGLGAEVIFELYQRKHEPGRHALRVLWNGQPMRSSNPTLGLADMIDLELFLGYVDGLVGVGASKVIDYCMRTTD